MKRFFKKYAYAMWLGGATSPLFGFSPLHWQWWVYTVVVILLLEISRPVE